VSPGRTPEPAELTPLVSPHTPHGLPHRAGVKTEHAAGIRLSYCRFHDEFFALNDVLDCSCHDRPSRDKVVGRELRRQALCLRHRHTNQPAAAQVPEVSHVPAPRQLGH
jgi:hypothetical protein